MPNRSSVQIIAIIELGVVDKNALIGQIVRDAPEFGVCQNSGAVLYSYFVYGAKNKDTTI